MQMPVPLIKLLAQLDPSCSAAAPSSLEQGKRIWGGDGGGEGIWIRKFIASLLKPINHPLTTTSFHTLLDLDKVFEPVVPPNISKGC